MTDMLQEIKARYHSGVLESNREAAAFRADVGYLLSLLGSERLALMHIFAHAKSRIDFMDTVSTDAEGK